MFANHSNRSSSSAFDSPSARHIAGRILGYFSRPDHDSRAELLPKGQAVKKFEGLRNVANPLSQNLSVRAAGRRAFSGRSVVTQDEVLAQEWLDNRLAAFYQEGHGFWPRVRRFLSGNGPAG